MITKFSISYIFAYKICKKKQILFFRLSIIHVNVVLGVSTSKMNTDKNKLSK